MRRLLVGRRGRLRRAEPRGRRNRQRRLEGIERAAAVAQRRAQLGSLQVGELPGVLIVLGFGELVEAQRGHRRVLAGLQAAQHVCAIHARSELPSQHLQRVLEVPPGGASRAELGHPVVAAEAVLDAGLVEHLQEVRQQPRRDVAAQPFAVAAQVRLAQRRAEGDLALPQPGVGVRGLHERQRGRLLHRDVDLRAGLRGDPVATVQRDHRRARDVQAGHGVRDVSRPARRRVLELAADLQEAAGCGCGEVSGAPLTLGAALAVRRRGDDDQVRVERMQRVRAEAQQCELSGLAGFDQDVSAGGDPPQFVSTRRRFDVDDERSFVGVEVEVLKRTLGSGLVIKERPHRADVRAGRRLDQQHVGAEVGEQACAERRPMVGQLQHPDSGQRQLLIGHQRSLLRPCIAADSSCAESGALRLPSHRSSFAPPASPPHPLRHPRTPCVTPAPPASSPHPSVVTPASPHPSVIPAPLRHPRTPSVIPAPLRHPRTLRRPRIPAPRHPHPLRHPRTPRHPRRPRTPPSSPHPLRHPRTPCVTPAPPPSSPHPLRHPRTPPSSPPFRHPRHPIPAPIRHPRTHPSSPHPSVIPAPFRRPYTPPPSFLRRQESMRSEG